MKYIALSAFVFFVSCTSYPTDAIDEEKEIYLKINRPDQWKRLKRLERKNKKYGKEDIKRQLKPLYR